MVLSTKGLFGVPVYGYLLATAAGFIESRNGDAQKAAILTKFSARDSEFLMRIDSAGDGVDWGAPFEWFFSTVRVYLVA